MNKKPCFVSQSGQVCKLFADCERKSSHKL